MAQNYNPRSGSSASRNPNAPGKRKAPAASKRTNARFSSSSGRNKVEYIQSAKTDLAAKTPENDSRASYARFRTDPSIRVLGSPEDFTQKSRHQINTPPPTQGKGQGQSGRSAARPSTSGVTVREHRQRQRTAARRQSKIPGRIIIFLLVLVFMAVVTLSVYFSPAFTVKKISVEGAHRLTSERLTELAAVPASSTLLRLDVEDIQKRVASDPWVKSVEVKRSFPETVVLVVEEREIAVVAEVSLSTSNTKVTNWLISTDGIWLGNFESPVSVVDTSEGVEGEGSDGSAAGDGAAEDETAAAAGGAEGETGTAEEGQTAPDAATTPASGASLLDGVLVTSSEVDKLIHIKDTSHSIAPGIGQLVNDEGVANALALINGFSPEMLGLIHSISAPDRINTTLTLDNYVLVAFGAAEDVAAKEKAILKLLAEHEDQLTYINVRVADRATYRATG